MSTASLGNKASKIKTHVVALLLLNLNFSIQLSPNDDSQKTTLTSLYAQAEIPSLNMK